MERYVYYYKNTMTMLVEIVEYGEFTSWKLIFIRLFESGFYRRYDTRWVLPLSKKTKLALISFIY